MKGGLEVTLLPVCAVHWRRRLSFALARIILPLGHVELLAIRSSLLTSFDAA